MHTQNRSKSEVQNMASQRNHYPICHHYSEEKKEKEIEKRKQFNHLNKKKKKMLIDSIGKVLIWSKQILEVQIHFLIVLNYKQNI